MAPEEVAQRLAARFGVDPATICVGARPFDYICLRALEVSLPKHRPPLRARVEAETGEILEVTYAWPDAGQVGPVEVFQGRPRPLPAVDQAAVQRLAVAAAKSCLDGVLRRCYDGPSDRAGDVPGPS